MEQRTNERIVKEKPKYEMLGELFTDDEKRRLKESTGQRV
jgi:hypothetical protein